MECSIEFSFCYGIQNLYFSVVLTKDKVVKVKWLVDWLIDWSVSVHEPVIG